MSSGSMWRQNPSLGGSKSLHSYGTQQQPSSYRSYRSNDKLRKKEESRHRLRNIFLWGVAIAFLILVLILAITLGIIYGRNRNKDDGKDTLLIYKGNMTFPQMATNSDLDNSKSLKYKDTAAQFCKNLTAGLSQLVTLAEPSQGKNCEFIRFQQDNGSVTFHFYVGVIDEMASDKITDTMDQQWATNLKQHTTAVAKDGEVKGDSFHIFSNKVDPDTVWYELYKKSPVDGNGDTGDSGASPATGNNNEIGVIGGNPSITGDGIYGEDNGFKGSQAVGSVILRKLPYKEGYDDITSVNFQKAAGGFCAMIHVLLRSHSLKAECVITKLTWIEKEPKEEPAKYMTEINFQLTFEDERPEAAQNLKKYLLLAIDVPYHYLNSRIKDADKDSLTTSNV